MSENNFEDVKKHCMELESTHAARNKMYNEMVKMFMMQWDHEYQLQAGDRSLNITLSPFARNQIMGAIRLMIATDPVFKVKETKSTTATADKLEKAADTLWKSGGRLSGNPLHYDMILSGILFSEVHTTITRIDDLIERAKGSAPAVVDRMKRAAEINPYTIETTDPRLGYPEFDYFGLRGFYRKSEYTWQEIKEAYGKHADDLGITESAYNTHTLHQYTDLERHWSWVDGGDRPLYTKDLNMPFIPINAAIIEGTQLFDKPEDKRQPFLYTLWKSKIWNRQNLLLTVIYDLVFKMGTNPQMIFTAEEDDAMPFIDWSQPGGIARVYTGQELKEFKLNVLDPSLMAAWDMADTLGTESTIYKQALGQALTGSNATFSLQSMLSQAGRLPLIWPQKKLSWTISDTAKMMLKWVKLAQGRTVSRYEGAEMELTNSDVPDYFSLSANLKISMPQDLNAMANIALALSTGDNPLTSRQYARDEFLNIGDSGAMDEQIWNEEAATLFFKMEADKTIREEMMGDPMAGMQSQGPGFQQQPRPQQQQIGPNIIQYLMNLGAPEQLIQAVQQGQITPQQAIMQMGQAGTGNPQQPPGMGGAGGPMI